MLCFAKWRMGFTEFEFWKMTLKKYIALRDEWFDEKTQEEIVYADDVL